MVPSKVILYYARARAPRGLEWALEQALKELGVAYVRDVASDEDMRNILKDDPFGSLPAIVDGATTVLGPVPIYLYLQRKYGPELSEADHSHILRWVMFADTTLGQTVVGRDSVKLQALLGTLNAFFTGKDFLVAGQFTMADLCVGSCLADVTYDRELEGITETFQECYRYCKAMALTTCWTDQQV